MTFAAPLLAAIIAAIAIPALAIQTNASYDNPINTILKDAAKIPIIVMFLLISYAIGHAAYKRGQSNQSGVSTLARIDAVLAKICYPICLLIHLTFLTLLMIPMISYWRDEFPLGVAMSFVVFGPLTIPVAIVMLWCSLAFVSSWFHPKHRGRVILITLIVSLIELILAVAVYLGLVLGIHP